MKAKSYGYRWRLWRGIAEAWRQARCQKHSYLPQQASKPGGAGTVPAGRRWMAPLLLVVVMPINAQAAPEVTGENPFAQQAGTLLLKMRDGYNSATGINTDVRVEVTGLIVRATLRQSFRNDSSEWTEGIYVFPLPAGAAVDQMRLEIGDRLIEGEIREKEKAKAEYEKATREGKRSSLVRQQRPNLFTTSVANIAPGETITVEIGYLDTARYDEETFSLRVPMTLTPRYIPGTPLPDRQGSGWSPDTHEVPDASMITPPMVASSADHRVSLSANIRPGMPLSLIASRYHPVNISRMADGYDVSFAPGDVPMDHDIELLWRPVKEDAPHAMAFTETVGGEPHLLLMVMPPDAAEAVTIPPREVIFVIDTSGSMHGVSIEQARSALLLALEGLRPEDRFNVIQFNSVTQPLFPASVQASPDRIETARRYVDGLAANGGTEMRPALELALAGRPRENELRQVIFITDGSVGNEDALFTLIGQRLGASRLFTVGIGSAPNGWFMQKAAEAGRGTFVTISALHEVEEKMQRLFRKIEKPMLTDLAIEWPSDLALETYPATVPDLYAGEPVVIKARLSQDPRAGDQLRITGRLAAGSWGVELPLADSQSGAGIAAVWARAHIAELLERGRRAADPESVREAVTRTALRHHLVSKHTSLVAVDKTPARTAAQKLASEQVPNLVPYGQDMNAIFGFPATATAAPAMRRNGSMLLALGTLVLFWKVLSVRGRGRDRD